MHIVSYSDLGITVTANVSAAQTFIKDFFEALEDEKKKNYLM